MWILIVGNPIEGFSYYGPYGSQDEAIRVGEEISDGGDWWIAPLTEKNDLTRMNSVA